MPMLPIERFLDGQELTGKMPWERNLAADGLGYRILVS